MGLVDSIARLTEDIGAARAEGTRRAGEVWANALNNVGALAASVPAQIQQNRIQTAEAALRQQQAQINQMQLAGVQRHFQGQQALAHAIQQFPDDPQKTANFVSQAGFPDEGNAYLKVSTENAENVAKLTAMKRDVAQREASLVGDTAYGADSLPAFTARIAYLNSQGLLTDATKARLSQVQDPNDWPSGRQQLPADSPKNQAQQAEMRKIREIPRGGSVGSIEQGVLMKGQPFQTPAELAYAGAQGDTIAQQALGLLKPPKDDRTPATGSFEDYVTKKYGANPTPAQIVQAHRELDKPPTVNVNVERNDVKDAVQGMKEGTVPPQLPGRASKEYVALIAEARRQNFDLAKANLDWTATTKHIATLNNAQQTRLNQAINQLPDLLDSVDRLASQWKGGRFPILNRANLALAKNGAYGEDVASVARKLDQQIADVNADLGVVYMGGNSPTDHALQLAKTALGSDWSEKVLHDMVNLARQNVQIRQNSIRNTGVQGASPTNPYAPPSVGPVEEWVRDKNGKLVKKGS